MRLLVLVILPLIANGCSNSCSRNGHCNSDGKCVCSTGYDGADCSLRMCPSAPAFSDSAISTDSAHQPAVCSGRGKCDPSAGECLCHRGFTGTACERTMCPNNCNRRGRCLSMRMLSESDSSQQHQYDNWDADKIFGCKCDSGYAGYDCSVRLCPTGDDPLTTVETNNEVQLLRCTADVSFGGHIVLMFDGKPSGHIPTGASSTELKHAIETLHVIREVSVVYSAGPQLCRSDGVDNIVHITFLQNFGPQPPFVPLQFHMEPSSVVEIAAADDSYAYGMFTDQDGIEHHSVKGNKENEECSNRGLCDQRTGTCKCFSSSSGDEYGGSDGYGGSGERGDCGHAIVPITNCPSSEQHGVCSGHGWCDDTTKRCSCEEGYTAGDCSLRTCKKGLSWFDYPSADNVAHQDKVECSNAGSCSRSLGECTCQPGFFGAACEFFGCVHENYEYSQSTQDCSGHGRCHSMRELALAGDPPHQYGTDPNNPVTWDADRVFGCLCDEGWEGYDCSLQSCAKGMNPDTGDMGICSDQGICDTKSGECKCFTGWGSSDGSGSGTIGGKDDCGYRLKLRGRN